MYNVYISLLLMVVLLGDLRQTLPALPRSSAADEINACLKLSTLWSKVIIDPPHLLFNSTYK